jgi:hypothetical protein
VGVSNWGGTAKQIKSIFLHTTINWAIADCVACGTVTPNPHGAASSQHHGQRPNVSVWLESTVGASNWVGSAVEKKIDFFTHNNQLVGYAIIIDYYCLLFALSFTILCLTILKFFLPIEIFRC